MSGCFIPEINAEMAWKLILGSGIVNAASVISPLVTLRDKIAGLRAEIKNSAGKDVSGLSYSLSPNKRRLLAYKFSARMYLMLVLFIVCLVAGTVYIVLTAGEPKLLSEELACAATIATLTSLLCAVISLIIVISIVRYVFRLQDAVEEE